MCTILFSWKSTQNYKLILAANRDEFYERETKTAHWWDENPNVLGGKDLKAGGSWMGINKNGKIAAITNYRKFPLETYETSRGHLVKKFLVEDISSSDFMAYLQENGQEFDGFNLIFGNADELMYFSNRGPSQNLQPSIYGLSNHLLDTPWPKVRDGKKALESNLSNGSLEPENIFKVLSNRDIAGDEELPNTGIGLEKERMLSSIFIESPNYGTRLSTVLTIDSENKVRFHERSFIPEDENYFEFDIK